MCDFESSRLNVSSTAKLVAKLVTSLFQAVGIRYCFICQVLNDSQQKCYRFTETLILFLLETKNDNDT